MSILIKGAKMPETCEECPVVTVCGECHYELVLEGEDFVPIYVKDSCPLVEVPPHGRLIDADKLEIERRTYETYDDYSKAFDMIDNAPTVIESEEQEHEHIG